MIPTQLWRLYRFGMLKLLWNSNTAIRAKNSLKMSSLDALLRYLSKMMKEMENHEVINLNL